MSSRRVVSVAALALLAAACAPATNEGVGAPPPDRVLTTDMRGAVIRQQALTDRATVSFKAPLDKVWPAVMATYAEMGLEANFSDRSNGRYGVRGYNFPRALRGERRGAFFSCGSSITGANVDMGTVISDVLTTLTTAPDGTTNATVYVVGWLRRSDGSTTDPISCSSTGRLEEAIRRGVETKVAAM